MLLCSAFQYGYLDLPAENFDALILIVFPTPENRPIKPISDISMGL
jgi:hypothetical protein